MDAYAAHVHDTTIFFVGYARELKFQYYLLPSTMNISVGNTL